MLELRKIKKDYALKDQEPVHALKGISLNFRRNEFVAILGPSGCGKTTLLNITGGLDHYDSGDLVIEGKSTKKFKDADWDTYRNHSIGFVFQSYNLIAHQTILKNVELALTIAGISKEERTQRAMAALDKVGLKGLYKKKPNQMSGGQMQRVAIARALINNPEIVLADEPTGALDSETSVQIMELLKEVAETHLVIMVTHNPELAEKYATRIVCMKDGEVIDDTAPYDGVDNKKDIVYTNKGKKKRTSMSFLTATKLSFSNLFSKSKRTILVAVAGSIGIIGVSTILGVSCGVNNYIEGMENDLLSSYPIQINETTVDTASLLNGLSTTDKKEITQFDATTKVGLDSMIQYLMNKYADFTNIKTNDITPDLVDYINQMPSSYSAAVNMDYGIDMTNNFFTRFTKDNQKPGDTQIVSLNGLTQSYTKTLMTVPGFSEYASFVSIFTNFMKQLPGEANYTLSQYDLIAGSGFPDNINDPSKLVLVVDKNTTMTDLILAQMGFYPQNEFLNIARKAVKQNDLHKQLINGLITPEDYDEQMKKLDEDYKYNTSFSFEEIIGHDFYYFPHGSIYSANPPFVSSSSASLSLNGEGPDFENPAVTNKYILALSYIASYDAVSGTMITLDSDGNFKDSQTIIFQRREERDTSKSVVDGKWGITINLPSSPFPIDLVLNVESEIDEPYPDERTIIYKASGEIAIKAKTPMGDIPVGTIDLPTGKITEVESASPDYYYNWEIEENSYANEDAMLEALGGVKVQIGSILRAKNDTQFGSLSRGVYYTKALGDKFRKDASESSIVEDFKKHINYYNDPDMSMTPFNAYVEFVYDDYTNEATTGHPETVGGYASALNAGGMSTENIASFIMDFLGTGSNKNSIDKDKTHLRSLAGLKVTETVIPPNEGENATDKIQYGTAEVPQTISFYPHSFDTKDQITSYLNTWNKDVTLRIGERDVTKEDRSDITLTDNISIIVVAISTLVNTVSIALIAFTSLSLVVSCFMIAVITVISVMERIKEIGVIRSLGGRKRDVSRLFIAENLITGAVSGAIGIFITYLLQILINAIVKPMGIPKICALPWYLALLMWGIAVALSVLSGLIPSLKASKQDPVNALRSE